MIWFFFLSVLGYKQQFKVGEECEIFKDFSWLDVVGVCYIKDYFNGVIDDSYLEGQILGGKKVFLDCFFDIVEFKIDLIFVKKFSKKKQGKFGGKKLSKKV